MKFMEIINKYRHENEIFTVKVKQVIEIRLRISISIRIYSRLMTDLISCIL